MGIREGESTRERKREDGDVKKASVGSLGREGETAQSKFPFREHTQHSNYNHDHSTKNKSIDRALPSTNYPLISSLRKLKMRWYAFLDP